MKALLPLACLLALTACGSGSRSTTGQVTEVGERVCLKTTRDNGFCFTGPAQVFEGVQKGACVRVDYTESSGVLPVARSVRAAPSPCSG